MQADENVTLLCSAIIISGCAGAPPGTPGAGRGETYTPIVDMQGVDLAQYDHDLRDCRQYAGYIDRDGNTINGAVSGAIVMGILAAALGGNRRTIDQSASAGGFAGMTNMEARSAAKQERVLINCMTGRGYRALDGAYAPRSEEHTSELQSQR